MPKPGYGGPYRVARAALLASHPLCAHCGERPAVEADHQPPLSAFAHPVLWQGVLVPSCKECRLVQAGELSSGRAASLRPARRVPEPSRRWV